MTALLVVQREAGAGLGLLTAPLAEVAAPVVVRPYAGEALPSSLEGYAGLVVLGGAMAAWEDDVAGWLPATRRLLRDAVRAELPTLGLCLGAQLLARACGGRVERGGDGLEVGTVPVRLEPAGRTDPLLAPIAAAHGPAWPVRHYHGDAVTGLPPDADLLVTAEPYPHQGFRVGAAAWGLQYHPEVTTEAFERWVRQGVRDGEVTPDQAGELVARARAGAPAQEALATAHARAYLAQLRTTG
jgi:GMP synthase (glutamine-hydrolysing)